MGRKSNMCRIDQGFRLLVSFGVLYLALFMPEFVDNVVINGLLVVFGVVNTFAAVTAFCPVYYLANFSTLRKV